MKNMGFWTWSLPFPPQTHLNIEQFRQEYRTKVWLLNQQEMWLMSLPHINATLGFIITTVVYTGK